jgi:transposase
VALPTPPDPAALVTLGVDSHADTHAAAALDQAGRLLGTRTAPTTPAGYAALLAWAGTLGRVDRIGVEGTGSHGAGLARWLRVHGQAVLEVDRPDRATRRRQGRPTPWTPTRPPGRCRPARPRGPPRPPTARWR